MLQALPEARPAWPADLVVHTASPAPYAVDFDAVSRRFGSTLALDDVCFSIRIGETVALLGPNGAGKSTALGIMLGLLDPGTGTARTLGLAPRDAVRSGRVGAMLQAASLPPGAKVGELIDLARGLQPHPAAAPGDPGARRPRHPRGPPRREPVRGRGPARPVRFRDRRRSGPPVPR